MTICRVVLDTNTILMPLARGRRSNHFWIVQRCERGELTPLTSQETREELVQTLGKPHLGLHEEQVQEISASYFNLSTHINVPQNVPQAPRCRGLSDQKFIDPAHHARADALVTRDPDILDLDREPEIPILSLQEFTQMMNHPV